MTTNQPQESGMVTTQISKSLYDERCMTVVGADDTHDDIWYVAMPESTYERLAASTHGSTS